ncbi:uncharacterized protein LOC131847014 [Achroia grisella]|uniref:uncharacterized protein LOC131847014 n=1 Tax=Achroia grisella TaxID=688607 RepID=UPI0027D22AE4|nr:uncharacterized protein LOC131847014 [Achroia grisella]
MKSALLSTFLLATTITYGLAYHDPDLNYHLGQVQKLQNCDNGYSYPTPAIQLTTSGVKVAAPPAIVPQQVISAPVYQYSQAVAPQISYAPQPAPVYQPTILSQNDAPVYSTKEVHGYATSAGLSSAASSGRRVTPLATYAQAPIIAKVTAAPLFARFSITPPKTTYLTQNSISQQAYTGSLAKASLNSYSVQGGGPVVSQVYAAPSAGYATSPALRVQQNQVITPATYNVAAPAVTRYTQAVQAPQVTQVAPVTQYATSSVTQVGGTSTQYFRPAQYSTPVITQYTNPAVTQYAVPTVAQYTQPAQQVQRIAPISHISAPVLPSVSVPVTGVQSGHISATPVAVKNVHTEFLENYDAHPRYAYEYSVNDPHTGDIKQQREERDGEVVKGQYSLVEPDGSVRTVDYVADWETGFHADVRNSKDNQH